MRKMAPTLKAERRWSSTSTSGSFWAHSRRRLRLPRRRSPGRNSSRSLGMLPLKRQHEVEEMAVKINVRIIRGANAPGSHVLVLVSLASQGTA